MQPTKLFSRSGDASVELVKHTSSFNLIDPAPFAIATGHALNKLAYYNATPFGIVGGLNSFSLVCVYKPEYTTPGTQVSSGSGYTKASTNENFYDVADYGYDPAKDSWGINRGSLLSCNGGIILPNTILMRNKPNDTWQFAAKVSQVGNNLLAFNDGIAKQIAFSATQTDGLIKISIPSHVLSVGAAGPDVNNWDNTGVFNPQVRFALLMYFNRELSLQELYDLYGMIMFGNGYCINRQGLKAFWLARQDSTFEGVAAGHAETLPAVANWYDHRVMIPDLSGNNIDGKLFTDKTTWAGLLDAGSSNANPNIYIPQTWYDSKNGKNSKYWRLDSSGSTIY